VESGRATAGVDWASQTHVGCVVDAGGTVIDRFDIAHDDRALTAMARRLRTSGVQDVAIERGDGPVVKVLLEAGFSVFVVPSRQIKSLRSRYGSAGNKDDRLDAYVLADTLRTDGHRWRPLREDHEDTRALRALCRARKEMVETRVQITNQLRSNLELALPGAIGLSPGSTARSPWRSCDGFRPRRRSPGCRASDSNPGWRRWATPAGSAEPHCSSG